MKLKDCFQLGYVEKPLGIHGEIIIVIDADDPGYYKNIKSLFMLLNGVLVPYIVESIKIQGNKGVVKLEAVQSHQEAMKFKGVEIYLPDTLLPQLHDGQFYYHELIGLQVMDEKLGMLGTITAYYDLPNNDLLAMEYLGKEILIPLNDAIVRKVNLATHQLVTALPDGLLDIYLNNEPEGDEV